MTRASAAALAALALAAPACGGKKAAPAEGVNLRAPSSAAFFSGYTVSSPSTVRPYVAIANAGRNDLSILDGATDLAVPAPILLRNLAIPVPDRPAMLATASLGDDTLPDPYAATPEPVTKRPDLLVAVSAGSSALQVVQTWNPVNAIDSVVTLDDDVLAIATVPAPAGTARLAVALANRKLAIVDFTRGAGDPPFAPIVAGTAVTHSLPFQPVALASMPDDQSHVYAASLEAVGPGPVFGVGEVNVAAPSLPGDLWETRALDARAPTRLVAAARLRERTAGAVEPTPAAFGCTTPDNGATWDCSGVQPVPRVYAVLDEASCGPAKRIDCGIAVIDPVLGRIPDDWEGPRPLGAMPYRAPIHLNARPLAFAAAAPPRFPPSDPAAVPADAIYAGSFMRLYAGEPVPALTGSTVRVEATTGVGAVANADGNTVFLDLGRSKVATSQSPLTATKAIPTQPQYVNNLRLWFQNPTSGDFAGAESPPTGNTPETDAARYITLTPGWSRDDAWSVTYQGKLPGLDTRSAEVGSAGGALWLAIQRSAPGATPVPFTQLARLWDPALGVHANDIVVITARSVGGACVGTPPPGTPANADPSSIVNEVELRVAALLPPTAAYPGGAVQLAPPSGTDPPQWQACFDALSAAASTIATLPEVTIRAAGLLLEGSLTGYAGRPSLGQRYVLRYPTNPSNTEPPIPTLPDEDTLAGACPVADWQGPPAPPPACDAACRASCEPLVLGRKVRRYEHVAESCGTPSAPGDAVQACIDAWPGLTFPLARGPALAFRVEVQPQNNATPTPARDLVVRFSTITLLSQLARPVTPGPIQANGLVWFDRSPWAPSAGYRFIVPYSTDSAMDTSPSTSPISVYSIR